MEFYCGTDIIEVDRIKKAVLETKGFKEKIFTAKEIEVGSKKSEKVRYEYYAGRFAAKEAIYKALSKIKDDFNFWEVEILNDESNKSRPIVNILNKELEQMKKEGNITIDVSISHISTCAVAMAVVKLRKN